MFNYIEEERLFPKIHGYYQSTLLDLGITNNEALVLRFIENFMASGECNSIMIGDKRYYWISYSHMRKQLPILNLKTNRSFYSIMNKFVSLGLCTKYDCLEKPRKTYFSFDLSKVYNQGFGEPKLFVMGKNESIFNYCRVPNSKRLCEYAFNSHYFIYKNSGIRLNVLKSTSFETMVKLIKQNLSLLIGSIKELDQFKNLSLDRIDQGYIMLKFNNLNLSNETVRYNAQSIESAICDAYMDVFKRYISLKNFDEAKSKIDNQINQKIS